jgi:hypothetical protein
MRCGVTEPYFDYFGWDWWRQCQKLAAYSGTIRANDTLREPFLVRPPLPTIGLWGQ